MTSMVQPAIAPAPTWWRRPGLDVVDDRLSLNGADLEALAREHGAPLFVYDLARPGENVRALQLALDGAGLRHVVRFALKACPDPRILAVLRGLGGPGEPGQRRHRRLLAGRGAPRPRQRLGARRDQPHGHERVRARPRRPARAPDPDQPRRREPDRAPRAPRARPNGRHAREPGRRRRLHGGPRVRRRAPDQVRHHRGPFRRRGRRGSSPRARRRHPALPRGVGLARRPAGRVRGGARPRDPVSRPPARGRLPDPRGQRRRRDRARGPRRRAARGPRRLRAGGGAPPRAVRRDGGVRAGRLRDEGRRRAAGRGGDRGAPRRHDVRRARHRLERQLRLLHLRLRAGARAGQGADAGRARRS